MRVRSIHSDQVIAVRPEECLEAAARQMTRHEVSALPVVNRNAELVGFVTERDIVRAAAAGCWLARARISDRMSADPLALEGGQDRTAVIPQLQSPSGDAMHHVDRLVSADHR